MIEYIYDARGKPITTTGSQIITVDVLNLLEYLGYIYDTEASILCAEKGLGANHVERKWNFNSRIE